MPVDKTAPISAGVTVPAVHTSVDALARRITELESALAAEKARGDQLREMLLALAEEDAPSPLTAADVARVLTSTGRERLEDILSETGGSHRGAQ